VAGWLPKIAAGNRATFSAAFSPATTGATASATLQLGERAQSTGVPTVTYDIGQPVAPWTSIEFYEGDVLLKRVTPAAGGSLALATQRPTAPGYSVYHAACCHLFADGTQRTTIPASGLRPDGHAAGAGPWFCDGNHHRGGPAVRLPSRRLSPAIRCQSCNGARTGSLLLGWRQHLRRHHSTLTISKRAGDRCRQLHADGDQRPRQCRVPSGATVFAGRRSQTQPSSQHLASGGNATFNVMATTSVGSLTYQWKLNGYGHRRGHQPQHLRWRTCRPATWAFYSVDGRQQQRHGRFGTWRSSRSAAAAVG